MEKVTIREIIDFYEKTLRKTIKNKKRLIRFEMYKSAHMNYIVRVLNGEEKIRHYYNIFLIYEPKPRLIMSLNIDDKMVNHYFTIKVLIPKLEKRLDDRNVATRIGKGTDFALSLIKKYIEFYKREKKDYYVLKIDISKFFYSIDHQVLKSMLKKDLDPNEYYFCCKIIDSTNEDYINKQIEKIKKRYPNVKIPIYEYQKGLPIGNLSSQCLSIYYLNEVDHYIIHDLHLKHYVRYMDDFLIFHEDKEYLQICKKKIIDILKNDYKLKINEKKTNIQKGKYGFYFLGYQFYVKNNRTIMRIKNSTIKNMKKKLKHNNHLFLDDKITLAKYFSAMSNYYYSMRTNHKKIRRIIDYYTVQKDNIF